MPSECREFATGRSSQASNSGDVCFSGMLTVVDGTSVRSDVLHSAEAEIELLRIAV